MKVLIYVDKEPLPMALTKETYLIFLARENTQESCV